MSGGLGFLGAVVWPPYVGVTQGEPGPGPVAEHEPFDDMNYNRAMITWRTVGDGRVLGSAVVLVPKGVFTHVVFFSGPQQAALMGSNKFEQPIVFDRPGIIELDPIQNQDYLPRTPV